MTTTTACNYDISMRVYFRKNIYLKIYYTEVAILYYGDSNLEEQKCLSNLEKR